MTPSLSYFRPRDCLKATQAINVFSKVEVKD